jgi:hypothetical protein
MRGAVSIGAYDYRIGVLNQQDTKLRLPNPKVPLVWGVVSAVQSDSGNSWTVFPEATSGSALLPADTEVHAANIQTHAAK